MYYRPIPSSDGFFFTRNEIDNEQVQKMVYSSVAAFVASGVTCAIYHPLDCLRVRWQLIPKNSPVVSSGFLRFGINIVSKEGLFQGLWKPGLHSNVTGMALSASIRFGCYEIIRDSLAMIDSRERPQGIKSNMNHKSAFQMCVAGILCGALGYGTATPFHLLKTLQQSQRAYIYQHQLYSSLNLEMSHITRTISIQNIINTSGLSHLWRGCIPVSCRGALFTSGQMLGYDGLKTFGKEHLHLQDGVILHVNSSIAASFGASVLSAPADLMMTKHMSNSGPKAATLWSNVKEIFIQDGVIGFWRGWSIYFARLTPVMLTYSTLYEETRNNFGIGYLS